jgi:transcriptional antiterminator RfaH
MPCCGSTDGPGSQHWFSGVQRPLVPVEPLALGEDVVTDRDKPPIRSAVASLSGLVTSGTRWYVVQTLPCAEHKAVAHLGRQGFESYLPQYLKKRRHARRIETVAAPLFPRYLFVAVDIAAQRWRSIQSTIGVARLVCNGDAPAPVPDAVLTAIKEREDECGFVRLERQPLFAVGDSIRVVDGVFAAHLGLFEGMTDNERVTILLELLGRKVRVVLNADCVAAA